MSSRIISHNRRILSRRGFIAGAAAGSLILPRPSLGFGSGGSASVTYKLSPTYPGQTVRNTDTAGLSRVSPASLSGWGKTIIFIGQSNIASFVGNFGDTPYSISNSLVTMFDISSGGLFTAVDNMIGCNGPLGSVPARIGDQLRTAGVPWVVLADMAIGGTLCSDWAAGGFVNGDIAVMLARLKAVGLTPTEIVWAQGEQDNLAGTSRSMYAASLSSVISTFRNLGVTCPFLVTKSTYDNGISTTIQSAYTDVIDNVSVFAGADTDTINSGRIVNIHFTQAQAVTAAGLHVTAIQAH